MTLLQLLLGAVILGFCVFILTLALLVFSLLPFSDALAFLKDLVLGRLAE